ncbi:beta-lactamase family protein [Xanthomonas hyacinthi]|uniref:Serine hydrolase n=2 Tax=Xanthomonas hyacinthi TaxID=56455 RepID=A0A2S7EXW8_9XANT|nr:serine hydrolase [Xanthomonas hyacinthi]QGY76577.1 beta-lactamase family protein [Xanthomonas hyacinthi]
MAAAELDRAIEQRMREGGMVGVGAAIIVDKRLVWTKGYGFADRERAIAFTPDTVMNIGSISKTFTGVALMRAVQEGQLSLDTDINTYLPFKVSNPAFPDVPITLRQLATHTSSITDRWSVYAQTYHYGGDAPQPLASFLADYFGAGGKYQAAENFLPSKPGSHREYSNIAAALAGYIVERAVGERLDAYTQRRIFAPLRMRSTAWFLSQVPPQRHAQLYVAQNGLSIPIPLYGGTTYPDGGVRTSVADLSRFFLALLNDGAYEGGRILQRRSVEEMLRFQYSPANKPDNVELDQKNSGIFWATKFNATRIGHGGSDPGVKTEMLSDLDKRVGIIVFTNTSLDEAQMSTQTAIVEALWARALTLREQRR